LNQRYTNIAYVLADPSTIGKLSERIAIQDTRLIFAESINEAEKYLYESQPDLLIISKSFLEQYAERIEKISSLYTGIKFIPVIYIGDVEDEYFASLVHFKEKNCFDDKDIHGIVKQASEHLKPTVRVRFWGVRGSTPCANHENIQFGGNTSCVEIDYPGLNELLILDSGTGIRNLGNFLQRKSENNFEGRIFITHPHWDHIQGFPFFKPFYSGNNKFTIYLPEQYRGGAQEILSGHLTKTFFPVTLDMLDAELEYVTINEELQDFGHYSIEYMVANHPTKTAMYKLRIGGLSIVYAPDNELPLKSSPIRFLDNLKEFIKDCDLLIHDAQFTQKQYNERIGWGHSAWERVVEIAKKSGVKNLILTHHDPDSNDDLLARREETLKQYEGSPFASVSLAKEGSEVRLPLRR
jgi:phosphoribosyl 1,2-cyclic phosphodiesterase